METTVKTVKETILKRKSPLAFSDKAISQEDMDTLLDAARWAASAYNEQPWRFVYARKDEDPKSFKAIHDIILPGNQIWAEKAAVLMLVIAKKTFSANGKPNAHAFYDAGQAVGTLAVQATAMGISLHQMGGFSPEKAIEYYNLNEDYAPVAAIALGYQGDPDQLPENLKSRELSPRNRKSISEFAFKGAPVNL